MRICQSCRRLYPDGHALCPKDGSLLPEPPQSGVLILGKYQTGAQLGLGGFGVVCRAMHLRLREDRALKILLDDNEHMQRAFEGEARLVRALRHSNIVEIFDIEETEGGQLFVAIELV